MKNNYFTVNYVKYIIIRHLKTINSLRLSDATWWYRSGSTLVQVMACCLTAPSHYLNQCGLIISEVVWHSPEGNFTENAEDIYPSNEFETYKFNITATYSRDQWVTSFLGQPWGQLKNWKKKRYADKGYRPSVTKVWVCEDIHKHFTKFIMMIIVSCYEVIT